MLEMEDGDPNQNGVRIIWPNVVLDTPSMVLHRLSVVLNRPSMMLNTSVSLACSLIHWYHRPSIVLNMPSMVPDISRSNMVLDT